MKELNISEILGICVAKNIALIKVLEKSGFTKEFEDMGIYQTKKEKTVYDVTVVMATLWQKNLIVHILWIILMFEIPRAKTPF